MTCLKYLCDTRACAQVVFQGLGCATVSANSNIHVGFDRDVDG